MDDDSSTTPNESDAYQREKEYINEITDKHKVVIFSKTWCPFCKKLKTLFSSNKIQYASLELDNHFNGPNIQDALELMTGGPRSVPFVYISNKYRGGYNEIMEAWADGILHDWLKGIDTDFHFDLVVIGGGVGGLAAAKEAAKLGKVVAVCDYVQRTPRGNIWELGGTSVNVGSISMKLMHRSNLIFHDIKDAETYGWNVNLPEFHSWEVLTEKIKERVKCISWDYKKQLREMGISYYQGRASFIDNHTIEVDDGTDHKTHLTTRTVVIATGSRPMLLSAEGFSKFCITTNDLFVMPRNPGKVLVIGAGYIALECASFLNGFGCEVKVMVRGKTLKEFDPDMALKLVRHMEYRGIEFSFETYVKKFSDDGKQKIIVDSKVKNVNDVTEVFDTVLVAIGRCPNVENLRLNVIGVKVDKHSSKIIVNKREQTSVVNVFAIGDVTINGPELATVAAKSAKLLMQRLYNLSETDLDYKLVPRVVLTLLEYAYVGETEDNAKKSFGDAVEIYHDLYQSEESALPIRFDARCYCKMICRRIPDVGEKIIGIHMLGPNCGEIIQGFAVAMKMGVTRDVLDKVVEIHPTCGEIVQQLHKTKKSAQEIGNKGCL